MGESGPRYRSFRRYLLSAASPSEVALSLRPRSYLSHASALRAHGMVGAEKLPVYVNQEQRPKLPSRGSLTQQSIDRAFQNRARESRYAFSYQGAHLVLLAGKHSGNYRVEEMELAGSDIKLPVTDLVRTIVDVTVRPSYAAGPMGVLEAYRHALHKIDPQTLIAGLVEVLGALGHVYPYHQAIGYYLTKAGLPPVMLNALLDIGSTYDFYICHRIEDPVYDSTWRLHVPRALADSE